MTLFWLSCLWVIASVVVAMLPMRQQYVPGVCLLIVAPVLIGMIFAQYGPISGTAALVAFVSMFRNPLIYIYAKLRGQETEHLD